MMKSCLYGCDVIGWICLTGHQEQQFSRPCREALPALRGVRLAILDKKTQALDAFWTFNPVSLDSNHRIQLHCT